MLLSCSAAGRRVAAVDLRMEGLDETSRLAAAGDRLSTHVVDITDRDAPAALPEQVVAGTARSTG